MGRRIHSDKSFAPCRVLSQSQSKPPFWSSGATGEFNPEKWEWILTQDKCEPPPPLWEECYYPLEGSENPWATASLINKGTFWDGEGILQAQQDTAYHQERHLLCAQAARALTPVPKTKQWVWNVQLYQTDPAFPTQTDIPATAWISTSHKHLNNSHNQLLPSPIILQQGKGVIQIRVWNELYLQCNGSRHHPFHVSVKQFVPSVLGLVFNQTNLSHAHFVGTAGGGSSREEQFSELPWRETWDKETALE